MKNFNIFQITVFVILVKNSLANKCELNYGSCRQQCVPQYEIPLTNYDYACQRGYGWTMSHCCQKSSRHRQQTQVQQFLPAAVPGAGFYAGIKQSAANYLGGYGENKCEEYGGSCKDKCVQNEIIAHALYTACTPNGASYVTYCCVPPTAQAQLPNRAGFNNAGNYGTGGGLGYGPNTGVGMGVGINGHGVPGQKVKNNYNAPITINNYGKQNQVNPNKRMFSIFAGWSKTRGMNKQRGATKTNKARKSRSIRRKI